MMDEDELRAAFRTTMTRQTPPPMGSAAALAVKPYADGPPGPVPA